MRDIIRVKELKKKIVGKTITDCVEKKYSLEIIVNGNLKMNIYDDEGFHTEFGLTLNGIQVESEPYKERIEMKGDEKICPICEKKATITTTKDEDGYTVYSCSQCKREWYNTLDRAKKG